MDPKFARALGSDRCLRKEMVVGKTCCALMVSWMCVSVPAVARAFSSPEAYPEAAIDGGGGGRWFTGSAAEGFGCGVCHSAAPGQRHFPLYVSGLPAAGYEPRARYEILLSWPEFTQRWLQLRPNPAAPANALLPVPAIGLTAEFIAESGKASGTLEVSTASAAGAELCEQTRPNLLPRLGTRFYQVRPGVESLALKPDASGVLRCESRQLGQRCLIALSSCGAQQIRFSWTAPSTWEGPIWFSAGFVASEMLSGTFEADSVSEVSFPVLQLGADSAVYQQAIHSACAITPGPAASSTRSAPLLFVAALLTLGARLRRRARRAPDA